MNPVEAEAVVRKALRDNIGEEVAFLPLASNLLEDLGFDELDFVETAMYIERHLAHPDVLGGCGHLVEILDEDMMGWKTVQDVVDTVMKVTQPGYGRLPR